MQETENGSILNGFVRQRRNLIVISLVALFAETSELSVNKLNVFGNELVIRNPVTVSIALGIALLYWLYRYYVYFHDLGDKGFRDEHRTRLTALVRRWAKKKFDTDKAWKEKRIKNVHDSITRNSSVSERVKEDLKFPHEWKLAEEPDTMSVGVPHFQRIQTQLLLRLFVRRDNETDLLILHEGRDLVTIEGFEAMKLNFRAGAHVLVHTRIFSEYYLPFLVALSPISYYLYRLVNE